MTPLIPCCWQCSGSLAQPGNAALGLLRRSNTESVVFVYWLRFAVRFLRKVVQLTLYTYLSTRRFYFLHNTLVNEVMSTISALSEDILIIYFHLKLGQ